MRSTRAPWSSAAQTDPPPIQRLYAAAAPRGIRFVTRPVSGAMRVSVEPESSAQTEEKP
jgi:hypothetical protein